MTQTFFSSTSHAPFELGPELGRGGEGIVYQLKNDPGSVAKIYHAGKLPPIDKLWLMLQSPPDDPMRSMQHVSIVWLNDLVQNHKGQIFGIVMPKIPWGIPIHQLYHPRSRREKFVGFDWRYLHRSAANLAAAVAAIHAKGYAIGDLNESNVLVQPTALVSMIDTDSFQVPNPNGETFRCRVGKPEFTAPELQSVRLSTIDRSEEHDRFALAVMIFLLLMEGSHPFRGIGGPPQLDERIQQGLYPYSLTGSSSIKTPPLNPPFRNLHPEIQQLFQICFVDGFSHPYRRPRAAVWADALSYIENDFQQCSRNRHHVYLQTIPRCPWCERKQLLRGRDPFPESASSSKVQSPQKTASSKTTTVGARKARKYSLGDIFAILLVLGIAAALIVPSSLTAFNRSKRDKTKSRMREIMSALEAYRESGERYPKTRREIDFHKGLLPGKLYGGNVKDAWGTPFRYHSNDEHYRLISYGKDKLPGQRSNSEFDADIIFEDGEFLEDANDVTQLAPMKATVPTPQPTPVVRPTKSPASQEDKGWEFTYKSDQSAEALVIRATDSSAYFVAGQLEQSGVLLKLDAQGSLLWQKTLELTEEAYSQIRALHITKEGEIVVAGHTQRATEDRRDRLFCSFDEEELDWDCTSYQSSNYDIHDVHAIQMTPDGGFAMTGCVKSLDSDDWKIMAQQFDAERSFVWGKYYFPTDGGYSCGFAFQTYDDDSGRSERIIAGTWNGQGIVYKLDSQQEVIWDERFKGDVVNTLQLLPDEGVLLAGTGEKNWFTRLDANGEEIWGKIFNDPGRVPATLYHSKDDEYVLAGFTHAAGEQKAEVWVMRIDLDGKEPEYLHETNVNNPTEITSIAQASDGSYVLAGHYVKEGVKKLWVIKFEK